MSTDTPRKKKPYSRPQLKKWGTLIDLTETGCTTMGGDLRGGSVNPPGGGDRNGPPCKFNRS
jgi:hypothetical protein